MSLSELEREIRKTGSFNPDVFARENGAISDKNNRESTINKAMQNQANLAKIHNQKAKKSIEQYVNNLNEFKKDTSVVKDHGILSLVTAAYLWKALHTRKPTKYFLLPAETVALGSMLGGCDGTVTPQPPPPGPVEEIYLGVPVVYQPEGKGWCLPASAQSVLNYAGMDIMQQEIAPYVMEGNVGYAFNLANNSEKLGIDAYLEKRTLEEIKEEIIKERPPIVLLDYSLTDSDNHYYVVNGFSDIKQEVSLMCPIRGYMDMSYNEFKKLNDSVWGEEGHPYSTTSIWPKDESIKNINNYKEKAIRIVDSQMDSILGEF
jgi:hypothetical protein